jgi:hypothetical protein
VELPIGNEAIIEFPGGPDPRRVAADMGARSECIELIVLVFDRFRIVGPERRTGILLRDLYALSPVAPVTTPTDWARRCPAAPGVSAICPEANP